MFLDPTVMDLLALLGVALVGVALAGVVLVALLARRADRLSATWAHRNAPDPSGLGVPPVPLLRERESRLATLSTPARKGLARDQAINRDQWRAEMEERLRRAQKDGTWARRN